MCFMNSRAKVKFNNCSITELEEMSSTFKHRKDYRDREGGAGGAGAEQDRRRYHQFEPCS